MNELEKALHRLPKVNPEETFVKASKERLMHQIQLQSSDPYLVRLLKEWGMIEPSQTFMAQARSRVMTRIRQLPSPVKHSVRRLAYFLNVLKKTVASTLVMMLAVTATLFYVEGNTIVEASEDTFLEVLSGTASVKHADRLAWETVSSKIELRAGDLITLKQDSQAIIHFFDDTQLRLNQNTTLLISQLISSPAFSEQGIIEVNLNEGEVWAQTLNVDDGYAHLSLTTPEVLVKTLHGSFNVQRTAADTHVAMFDGKAELSKLDPISQKTLQKTRLLHGQKVTVSAQKASMLTADLKDQDRNQPWVQRNLERNRAHLADLRAKDLEKVTLIAGSLPGDTLYFIKKAKEDLKLVWSDDADLSLKIDIANKRLNEAIVLLEGGDVESGKQALAAYQELAREISEANKKENLQKNKKLANQLVVPHQKFFTAQLPSDTTVMVKDTLQKTAEILANNPVELATIKLRNNVDRLEDARTFIELGNMDAAKNTLTHLVTVQNPPIVEALTAIDNGEDQKEAIEEALALKEEQQAILASVSREIESADATDPEMVALVQTASTSVTADLQETLVAVLPLYPELAQATDEVTRPINSPTTTIAVSSEDLQIATVVQKIQLYDSWTGQKNQIDRLLSDDLQDPAKVDYLTSIRNQLTGRSADYLSSLIFKLQTQPVITADPIQEADPTQPAITTDEPPQTPETETTIPEREPTSESSTTSDDTVTAPSTTTDPIPQ